MNLPPLSAVFWNVKNIKRNPSQLPSPSNYDVIGLTETFLLLEWKSLPFGFSDFHAVWSPAIKMQAKGRASGGIVMLVNKKCGEPVLLHRSENWVFIKTLISGKVIIFGTIYFIPVVDIEPALELLESLLDSFNESYPGVQIVLGGDFNAHIGAEGIIDNEFLAGVNLRKDRIVVDQSVCPRDKLISEFMEDNNFFCLNGRSVSDTPGKITFLATTGRSIVDFIWVNSSCLPAVDDFEVSLVNTQSDHFPVVAKFGSPPLSVLGSVCRPSVVYRVAWDEKKSNIYAETMVYSDRIMFDFNGSSIEDQSNNLKEAIVDSAKKLNMLKKLEELSAPLLNTLTNLGMIMNVRN